MIHFKTQFQTLSLEHIDETEKEIPSTCSSSSLALYFDKGRIAHPTQVKTEVNFTGFFLLSLPLGEFPKIPNYDETRFQTLIRNWAMELYTLDHNANLEFNKMSLYPSSSLFLIAPSLKPWSKKTEIFLRFMFFFYCMDGFLAHAVVNAIPLLTKEHFTDLVKFISNIFSGYYRFIDGIPNCDIPFLNNGLRALFQIYVDLKEQVAGYEKYHVYLLKEIVDWVQSYKMFALHLGTKKNPKEPSYVDRSWRFNGRRAVIEIIQLLTATYINEGVRESVLFKTFCDAGGTLNNMSYDVFSLVRDSRVRKFIRNPLLINIRDKKIGFEEALDYHLFLANNEMKVFKKAGMALEKEFPHCEPLPRFIKNFQYFVDGSMIYFASQKRYGGCVHKVMKVVTVDGEEE